jgi:acetylglutamate kinase
MSPSYTHPDHDQLLVKANTLIEALPWLSRFAGETIVVKYGGNAMIDDDLKRAFAEDIVFLRRVGLKPIVVHGGGPQISSMLERLGITSEFRSGLRVTTSEAMDVVRMVLVGQVGRELVGLINAHAPFAVGMSGEDGGLLRARRRGLVEGDEEIDLGFVGDVESVDPSALLDLIDAGRIPVVATVAPGPDGQVYNVNADTAASALALALGAKRLVMLTDVAGLYANYPDESTIITSITPAEVRQLMPGLTAGMAPKMEACVRAVEGGVGSATIIDGRVPHCLLLEIFTDDGVGTMVCEEAE